LQSGLAVIRAKVGIPPLAETRVARPRVERVLADLIERHRTVVVSATAGAGKTTAVADAARTLGRPLAWLTLDSTDSAPGRLVTYLEAALAAALPRVGGVATEGLAATIPHPEVVGLLAEAAAGERLVLVLDELEQVTDAGDAVAVVEALLRYAPEDMRIVLVSRRRPPVELLARAPLDTAMVGEADLAFTPPEADEALERVSHHTVDAEAAVAATGGWVTGVLFEGWRYADHAGGDADPLHGYLSAHILEQLPAANRDFLIATSLLDEVTPARAIALGHADAAERLASLRAVHLPVSWLEGGRRLRCHPRFREYLLDQLERRGAAELRALRLAHGRLLAAEGHDEAATEELLAAGAPEEAVGPAGRAIHGVVQRADLALAERWLAALGDAIPPAALPFVIAELQVAMSAEGYGFVAAVADRLAAEGRRAEVAAASPHAALLMIIAYGLRARLDDMWAVFEEAAAGPHPEVDVLRYFMATYTADPPPSRPLLTGGPMDPIVLAMDFAYGRLTELLTVESVGWVQASGQQWLISALAASGRTEEALRLYDELSARGLTSTSLDTYIGPNVLLDGGRGDEAPAVIARGRRSARANGAVVYELLADTTEARVRLRHDRDPAAAAEALDRVEASPHTPRLAFLAERVDALRGWALLLEGEDEAAAGRLRAAAASMVRSERMLDLPRTAVHLAEAEWRLGDEEAADRAADLALDAARRQGSNHLLLLALADFPAVASRRIDAERAADSPWHELGRALLAQDVTVDAALGASVRLTEFGGVAIHVDEEEVRPRIAKAYELLAYLVARAQPGGVERDELVDVLFEGRADESSRAYLRQAVLWLRRVLPEGAVQAEQGRVGLGDEPLVTSESTRFEAALVEAARLRGSERLAATVAALEPVGRGSYLPGFTSDWAEERRRQLAELAGDARYEAAELAFTEGDIALAKRLATTVLAGAPLREGAWRLTMRLAAALGDDDGVIRAYQRCEQALAEVGAAPAPTTRALLERLRR
jgi:pentatricopeptide repeat protein